MNREGDRERGRETPREAERHRETRRETERDEHLESSAVGGAQSVSTKRTKGRKRGAVLKGQVHRTVNPGETLQLVG